jgi:predicted RNase H-like nuclease
MRQPDITLIGVSRADLTRALIRTPAGFGRDLLELSLLHRPAVAAELWDRYGRIDVYPHLDLRTLTVTDPQIERRAYYQASQAALTRMMLHGLRERRGTQFRWGAAMLDELGRCPGRRAAPTWRAIATESRYTEWRDRCDAVYQSALDALRQAACDAAVDLAVAIREIREGRQDDAAAMLRNRRWALAL